jgi:hypothetical protein
MSVIFTIIVCFQDILFWGNKVLTNVRFQVEDGKMSAISVRNKASEKFLKLNVIAATNFDPVVRNQNCSVPPDTAPLEIQVAGHSFGDGKNTIGDRTFFFYLDLYMLNSCYGIHL